MTQHIPGTRSLKVLEAAGRHLNFTRAAEELGLTPAAISHQIKEFEEQIGVFLFVRANRALRLTPAGEIMHAAAAETLADLSRAASRARKSSVRPRFHVTAPTSIAAKWLVPRLDRFARREPNVDVRINVSCEPQNFDRDDVDVWIRFGPGIYPGLRADRLFDHAIFPICSPLLLRSQAPLVSPSDLLRHTLIQQSWSGDGVTWPDWAMWLQAAGVEDFEPAAGLYYKETQFAIQAAIEGNGIALGDASLVADDLAAGRLVQPFALSIGGPPGFAYFVVSPIETADTSLVASFRDWILKEAGATFAWAA